MSDYISRADAIRVISEEYHNRDGNFDGLDAIRELETLPSKGGDAEMLNEDFRPKYMQQSPNNGADLISRADAIEHLKNVKVSYPHADISLPIDLAIKAIEILPSADAVDCTDFIEWLVDRVLDETIWENNSVAYGEIICRKLEKLGVLEVTEEPSYYIRPSADACDGRGDDE